MAMTNILKTVASVLKAYDLEWTEAKQPIRAVDVGISEVEGPLLCRVRKR